MNKKQILNEEFLKSIESEYVFSNKPINRLKPELNEQDIKSQLENLKKKISEIDNCDLKKNANNLVFSDGNSNSKIMIVGEGPRTFSNNHYFTCLLYTSDAADE